MQYANDSPNRTLSFRKTGYRITYRNYFRALKKQKF